MISETITKLSHNQDLSYDEMLNVMNEVLDGKISVQETANFLKNLTAKGESNEELLAMLDTMQKYAIHIEPKCRGRIIDVCGTGGDKMHTFNVSTTAAFVIAAGGVSVAKHGNRSTSGISGSADIFEYFGYDINMEPKKIREIIEKFNIGFMYAQKFHPAMKNVAEARKLLEVRTAFNLLGPLSNPAQVRNQLVGVFSPDYLQRIVTLLQSRGAENVMTVISNDGLDELSTTSKNQIYLLKNSETHNFILDPAELGLAKANLKDIQISTKDEAIRSFISVLNGTGKKSMIDITALNAAAGFIVGGISDKFDEALEIAFDVIHTGKSFDLFRNFIKYCGNISKVEELENK
ncbi:MAG: anthranilate phosphoribosyltransferase [Thaumarchaeota archaeon]|nr:anthranilate phosphoribosyltransferase [Nitrososphaerota archaeon]